MSEELVCKPSLDVVFKKLFTDNPELLKDFLNLVLETEIDDLTVLETKENSVTFLNTEILPDTYDEKLSRLDILLKTKNGEIINVEIQNRDKGNFKERSVFYCSKLYTMDFKSGKDYSEISKTVCINILQFDLFDSKNYRSTVFPIIQETGQKVTDKWEIIYFETRKLPKEISNRLERWLKFFTVDTKEGLIMMEQTNDTAIKKAAIVVRQLEGDELLREVIRRREDAQLLERVIRSGGYKDGKMDAARKMLAKGVSVSDIAEYTDLPISTIQSL